MPFKALQVSETGAAFVELTVDDLPDEDVLIEVAYSSLNYKDGLAVTGTGKVVRRFPMVPGIDLVGTVVESRSRDAMPGDKVIVTGWGLGATHWGGYAGMARVPAGWLVPLPDGLTPKQAMALGTAGLTAMLAIDALEVHGLAPDAGEVLVTGASGGVGSLAVMLLAKLGYTVAAATGREHLHPFLQKLGAGEIIDRAEVVAPAKPLQSARWAGAIDVVGGDTLATVLSMMAYGASVASIGLAGGHELNTTVYPFILRGVNLLGIDSAVVPKPKRASAWERLARDMPLDLLEEHIMQVAPLEDVPQLAEKILAGEVQGRVVIAVGE